MFKTYKATNKGKARPLKQSGFTLIEVMLVVLIMGLMIGVIFYTVDSSSAQKKLKRSAEKFIALTQVSLDKATLAGRDFGIAFSQDKYHFVELVEQRWQIARDPLLSEQSLEQIDMTLEVEGFEWLPDLDSFSSNDIFSDREINRELDEQEKPHIPQLLILSSGELTPFVLKFRIAEKLAFALTERQQQVEIEIKGNSLGMLTLEVKDQ